MGSLARRALLAAGLLASLLAAGAAAPAQGGYTFLAGTPRVYAPILEELVAYVNNYNSNTSAGHVPLQLQWDRISTKELAAVMATRDGKPRDFALIGAPYSAEQLSSYPGGALVQFPIAWTSAEVLYNLPQLGDTPLKLDACAVAAILTGNLTQWDDPRLEALNPGAPLPSKPIRLAHLNVTSEINVAPTYWLDKECPEGWPYGVSPSIANVTVGPGRDTFVNSDIEQIWRFVNSTPGSLDLFGKIPTGEYRTKYPAAAQQIAWLPGANGDFVPPSDALYQPAVDSLAALAPNASDPAASKDWTFLYPAYGADTPTPGLYPLALWATLLVRQDLTAEGARGHYLKDLVGALLTQPGQSIVNATNYGGLNNLPPELLPAAVAAWDSIQVSDEAVDTGLLTPLNERAAAGAGAPAPPPSGADSAQRGYALLLAAAAAGALLWA